MSARKHPPYGVKRNYRKIDIFHRADGSGWIYVGSTTWSRMRRISSAIARAKRGASGDSQAALSRR